jgi:hypothetical protein
VYYFIFREEAKKKQISVPVLIIIFIKSGARRQDIEQKAWELEQIKSCIYGIARELTPSVFRH